MGTMNTSQEATDVLNLVPSFKKLGNPFIEEGEKLTSILTKDIMDSTVVCIVLKHIL